MKAIKFGTDGLRGVINKDLTPKVAYELGCSLALFLVQTEMSPFVIVGEDTRLSCAMLKNALCAGLNEYGVSCICVGEMTTPALAYLTKKKRASAGVIITASHNSYEYNGFKIFNSKGMKIDFLTTLTLERYSQILSEFPPAKCEKVGVCFYENTYIKKYLKYLNQFIRDYQFKICFDCANGTTYKVVKSLFPKAKFVGTDLYQNKENFKCGATCPQNLKNFVLKENADIGFSFDGDGDRVVIVLKDGTIIDGDEILYILCKYYKDKTPHFKNVVVGTIITNFGIEQALNNIGIKLIRQNVGDRFISYEMKKKHILFGAEQAGHIIFSQNYYIGDGIYTAIMILNILQELNCDIKSYIKDVKKSYQINASVKVDEEMKDYVLENYEIKNFIEECENELGCKGRIVVRKSGTENLIRILVEGEKKDYLEKISEKIKQKIIEIAMS